MSTTFRISKVAVLCIAAVVTATGLLPPAAWGRVVHRKDLVARSAIVEQPSPATYVATGVTSEGSVFISRGRIADGIATQTTRDYYPDGSVIVSKETIRIEPDGHGGLVLSGKGRDVRGAGRYAGITGSYRITGTQAAGSHVQVAHLVGRQRY
jgi:hypothetical protein